MKKVLAIDPGDIESAYVLWDGENIIDKAKEKNDIVLRKISEIFFDVPNLEVAIEMVASYGMPVGKTVFDTCVWIGRFIQVCDSLSVKYRQVYRKEIVSYICHSARAKDSNVIQALVDRFGDVYEHGKYGKGTKKNPGFFYGFYKDVWQSFAVGVYYFDNFVE